MLRQEDYIVIKTLHDHDVYQKDIAAELGVHPKTVSQALQRTAASLLATRSPCSILPTR